MSRQRNSHPCLFQGLVPLLLSSIAFSPLLQTLVVAESACNVFLAESSIPDAGFGVYALKAYEIGDSIVSSSCGSLSFDCFLDKPLRQAT